MPEQIRSVVLDTSVLAGASRPLAIAVVATGYVKGYWSHWIALELGRTRADWVAERAVRQGWDLKETRRRQAVSARWVNDLVDDLTRILEAVDYGRAPAADLSWLEDPDDRPVIQTALAAGADAIVTEDRHFPIGETRNGLLFLDTRAFLDAVYARWPEARADVAGYLLTNNPTP